MYDKNSKFSPGKLPFWDGLDNEEKTLIYSSLRVNTYKKRELIYAGSGDLGVIILRSGRAYAYSITSEGRELVLLRLFPGDICLFAASYYVGGIGFPIYIGAEAETEAVILDSKVCIDICNSNQDAGTYFRRLMAKHFSDVVINMQNMLLVSAEKRIASYICRESDRTGNMKVRATHEQIAKNVGTAREVVSRTLGRLAADGIVELGRGGIVILDMAKLKELT